MAIIIKTKKEIDALRVAGRHLAQVLEKVAGMVAPGVSTLDLDQYAEKLIRELGDTPAFLNYRPAGARKPFPASLCTSINDEVVHGIPKQNRVLKEGDIISIDLGLKHDGVFADHAVTVAVGNVAPNLQKLLDHTSKALEVGISAAQPGFHTGDIGAAIESFVKPHKYGIVDILAGHGVGRYIHEDPYIPNFGKPGEGAKLVPGMVIAIEPMLNLGTKEVFLEDDDWTFKTADGKYSAHFEHTVLITEDGPEILTLP